MVGYMTFEAPMFTRIFICFFFLCAGCLSAEVELTFLPNKPVQQKSQLTIHLQQYLPSIRLNATMEQKLTADVSIVERSDLPVSQPPINILFTLKDLTIDLRANDKEASYQVNKPNTSLFLAEIQDMIDEPIKLRFDDHFRLKPDTIGLVQLSKELPILSQIHPQSFIEELFQHQFALANRQLEVGKTYTIKINEGVGIKPTSIAYSVIDINKDEIVAEMKGNIPPIIIDMPIEIPIGDVLYDTVHLTVDGEFSGEVRWSRKNALLYTLKVATTYRGVYQIADWEWTMDLDIHHQVDTQQLSRS
jgi:hypothetical protein